MSAGDDNMKNKVYFLKAQNRSIPYRIIRTKRKTIGITVEITGEIKVSAPLYTDERQIIEVVKNKSSWIIEKLTVVEEIRKNVAIKQFVDGEKLLFLGKEYELKMVDTDIHDAKVFPQEDIITVHIPKSMQNENRKQLAREALVIWYKKHFSEIANERIKEYSQQLRVTPCKVTIKEQKTIWGSCSSKGNINLNWRLVMAPIYIIDYVVVHELCHMKVMSHSKDFWNQVELIMPDYTERRKWLKENGHKLVL